MPALKKKPLDQQALTGLYSQYERGASGRKHDFDLDTKQFKELISSECHYRGRPPFKFFRQKRFGFSLSYNGINRKDNAMGYTVENCVTCCTTCNLGKHKMSYSEFLSYLKDLVRYRMLL